MYDAKDYETRIWWSAPDALYVAQCTEMPGIMAHGHTRAGAATSIHEAIEFALECAAADHDLPPVPQHRQPAAA